MLPSCRVSENLHVKRSKEKKREEKRIIIYEKKTPLALLALRKLQLDFFYLVFLLYLIETAGILTPSDSQQSPRQWSNLTLAPKIGGRGKKVKTRIKNK